jgi:polysaccharide biosynthesis transport protein
MLQVYKSPSVQVEEGASYHDASSAQPSFADLFIKVIGFIRRQFLVVLSFVPLTIGLAAAYLFTTPPLYSAVARMMIDSGKIQVFKQSILGEDPVNFVMMDSQLEILKSENFALSIVKNLHLTQDPEFVEPKSGPIGIARNVISSLFVTKKNEPVSELELTRRVL